MTQAAPKEVGQAAVDALYTLHGLRDDDRPRLKTLTIEAGIGWRANGFAYWNLWCATAASWAYMHVGDHLVDGQCVDLQLRYDVAKYFWASTTRLVGEGTRTYKSQGVAPPIYVEPEDVRAGDVLLIKTPRTEREWGDHVALARGPLSDGVIPTIAGNEWGIGPDGERMKGVVEGEREVSEIARIIRPPLEWLTGSYLDVLKEQA